MNSRTKTEKASQQLLNLEVEIEFSGSNIIHYPGPHGYREGNLPRSTHSSPNLAPVIDNIVALAALHAISVSQTVQDISPRRRLNNYYDGGYDSHIIQTVMLTMSSIPVAVAAINALRDIVVQWIKVRGARDMKMKIGQISFEIKSPKDLDTVLLRGSEIKNLTALQKGAIREASTPTAPRMRRAKGEAKTQDKINDSSDKNLGEDLPKTGIGTRKTARKPRPAP